MQKWLLNVAIFCLSVVIVGFIFSMGGRFLDNTDKIQLSQSMDAPPPEPEFSYIVVEVLNGCGTSGVAQKFTNYLRQAGIDVIYTGNADRMDYALTHVVQRAEATEKTQEILTILELDASRIVLETNAIRHVDLSIILGKDFQTLPVYSKVLEIREQL